MSAAQTLWADLVIAALAEAGVADCVVSPGSRSTPLVAALMRASAPRATVVIDERAAAFYALGAARATGRPVALVCTSGSAPGHYLPAVIEAAMAEVPLVVLSADRPAELLDAGAAQTITQPRLFGEQVRAQLDLGPPTGEPLALRAVRRRVVQAVLAARGPIPGPVHVNVPLRKPLEPVPLGDAERALAREAAGLAAPPPPAAPPRLWPDPHAVDELAAAIAAEPRGLIVVGALPERFADSATDEAGAALDVRAELFALAELCGYPLLAETGSGLRLGPRPAALVAIDHADLIWNTWAHREPPPPLQPQLVLQLGAEPVGSGWQHAGRALPRDGCWAIARRWQDPSSRARMLLAEPALAVAALRRAVASRLRDRRSSPFTKTWRAWQAEAEHALAAALEREPRSEVMAVAGALGAARTHAARVILGNSLPIRVADWISPGTLGAFSRWLTVSTQRGASGIDGVLAGACGAAADGAATVAILGDVTFAHDVGSLALVARARAPLALVVLDNGGGRIFDQLPVARADLPRDDYARYFTTAPGLDPVAIAHAFGVRAARVDEPRQLAAAVALALSQPGATVLHVPVTSDGAHTVYLHACDAMFPRNMTQGTSS